MRLFCTQKEEMLMRESRLFKIVYHLLDKGQATAPELAEKFEVSVRTIYRDIDALSGAGIPVYAETGRNGGIHFRNFLQYLILALKIGLKSIFPDGGIAELIMRNLNY